MSVEAPVRTAAAMATPALSPTSHNTDAAYTEQLAFRLGAEEYGVDILRVQEIRGYTEPTRIANAQPYLKGVINLRGTIVPIVDLRVLQGLSQVRYDTVTATIVVNVRERVIGVVVDAVSDVLQLSSEQIKPAPAFESAALATAHVAGIATLEQADSQRMLILVDIEQWMSTLGLI